MSFIYTTSKTFWVVSIIVCLSALAMWSAIEFSRSETPNKQKEFLSSHQKEQMELEKRKAQILAQSYAELILTAENKASDDILAAANHFFDAKCIYPRAITPRYELVKIYFELAQEDPRYCYYAQKEIKYAFHYVDALEQEEIHKDLVQKSSFLKSNCGTTKNYAFHYDLVEDSERPSEFQ